jgi:hypothetical protein
MDKKHFILLAEQIKTISASLEGEDFFRALENKLKPFIYDVSLTILEFGDILLVSYAEDTDEVLVAEVNREKVVFRNAGRTDLPIDFGVIPEVD